MRKKGGKEGRRKKERKQKEQQKNDAKNIRIRCNTTAIYHSSHVASFYHITKNKRKHKKGSFTITSLDEQ